MKKLIVVEGCSGSGKSTFSKLLGRFLGLEYVNLDDLAKTCYKEKGVIEDLKKFFPSFLFDGKCVNFRELGKIVFNDAAKLKLLENILYPCLVKKIEEIVERSINGCVLDGIKVHETKFFEEADFRIFIERNTNNRIHSLVTRDFISIEQAKERDNAISFEGLKYDFYINNDGNIMDLNNKLAFVIANVLKGNYCMYAGSFDPFTNGHLELVRRASKDYDYVFVGIGDNPNKMRSYDKDEMADLINNVFKVENIHNAFCFGYKGYTGEVANILGVKELVRGIRNEKDELEEKNIEEYNLKHFNLKTKYYVIEGLSHVSSSDVRYKINNNLSIKGLVPYLVEEYVLKDSMKKS